MGIINWRGAIQGGAETVQAIGLKAIENDLLEQRQSRIAELQAVHAEKAQDRSQTFQTSERVAGETARRDAELNTVTTIDPLKNKNSLQLVKDSAQARIDIESSPENVQKAIDKLNLMAPATAKVARDAMIADLQAKATPEALNAAGKIARATHIESASSQAQAKLAGKQGEALDLTIKDKKRLTELQNEYLNEATTPERKEALTTEMNVLQGKREDVIKMRVKVGEDAAGQAIMEDVLVDSKTKKRIDIGGGSVPSTAGAPAVGTVVGGFKFKGGNPKDRSNWEESNPVFGGSGGFTRDTTSTDVTKPSPTRQPIRDINEWVREKGGIMGGYRYKNLNTGETIGASEFQSRTR